MKVYIEHSSQAYVNLFQSLGYIVTHDKREANLAVFTGGADVSPSLYGDAQHKYTGNDPHRDAIEKKAFEFFSSRGIPCVGICRGGQFLNVMSGGRMYQHVSNHTGDHVITDDRTGETVYVSSTHHQMFLPSSDAILVASSALGGTREWYEGEIFKKDVSDLDFEVVYYPATKCLCFQPHPEFSAPEYKGMKDYFKRLLKEFF